MPLKTKRIGKELADARKRFSIELENDQIANWIITFNGPENTPYSGRMYRLSLTFTESYPTSLPTMKFISRIFHPLVTYEGPDAGVFCIDENTFTPCDPIADVIEYAINILAREVPPGASSILNQAAYNIYQQDREVFREQAKMYSAS